MRPLTFSLLLLAALSPQASAQRPSITRPIQQARAAVAKSDARTAASQAVVQEPSVRRDSVPVTSAPTTTATSSPSMPASKASAAPGAPASAPATPPSASPVAEKGAAAVAPPQVAGGKGSAAGTKAPVAVGKAVPPVVKAPAADTPHPDSSAATVSVGSMAPTRPELRIDREVFAYDAGGRRDPFVSLFSTSDLRPLFSDLLLVVINYDPQRRNSVAIMRDATTKEQYRVRQGQLIGRMRVAAIEQKRVLFTIDEFGFSRQESLVIGDTTKVRKQ